MSKDYIRENAGNYPVYSLKQRMMSNLEKLILIILMASIKLGQGKSE